jgi:hypothetical protein
MFVCLNSFVIKVVSLPVYVKVAQALSVGFFSGSGGVTVKVFGGRIGKALLWMMFSSCWNSVGWSL